MGKGYTQLIRRLDQSLCVFHDRVTFCLSGRRASDCPWGQRLLPLFLQDLVNLHERGKVSSEILDWDLYSLSLDKGYKPRNLLGACRHVEQDPHIGFAGKSELSGSERSDRADPSTPKIEIWL